MFETEEFIFFLTRLESARVKLRTPCVNLACKLSIKVWIEWVRRGKEASPGGVERRDQKHSCCLSVLEQDAESLPRSITRQREKKKNKKKNSREVFHNSEGEVWKSNLTFGELVCVFISAEHNGRGSRARPGSAATLCLSPQISAGERGVNTHTHTLPWRHTHTATSEK